MKAKLEIVNTTNWTDAFLRRLVAWCCRQSGLPVSTLRRATFKNKPRSYRGFACGRRIQCSIGLAGFPNSPDNRPGMQGEVMADRMEALVAITAHEVEHICQHAEGRLATLHKNRSTERITRVHEVRCLRLFRANREALLAKWSKESTRKPVRKLTVSEKNEANARKRFEQWERRAASAQRMVKKYRERVRYYDRKAAKRATQENVT